MTTEITKYLLTICYHCEDAQRCATEEECRACLVEQALQHDEEHNKQELTTEQLLWEYAL